MIENHDQIGNPYHGDSNDVQLLLSRSEYFFGRSTSQIRDTEVSELQSIVRAHNHRYYIESDPLVDDGQYDRLFRLLSDAEERLGIFDANSPTKRIEVLLSRQFEK